MLVTHTLQKQVSVSNLAPSPGLVIMELAGQGMNASINDSHNLGMSSFPLVTIELNYFLSLEDCPGCSWVGGHAPFDDGKLLYNYLSTC
jgi:hypothetical protein